MKKREKLKMIMGLLIAQIVIFAGVILSSNFYYQTNDDTTIIALASGAYGQPSVYLDNIHIFLGYVFKTLFYYLPVINWITIFFIIVLFTSFIIIDYLAVKLCVNFNYFNYLIVFITIEISWFMVITYFTFTIVAYVSGISGILCLIYQFFSDAPKRRGWVIGSVLLLLCTLIRGEVLKSLILVIFPLVIFLGITKKKLLQSILIIAGPLVLMMSMNFVHTALYNMNDIQREFWEWGEIRSAAVDCAPVDYITHEEEFKRIGVDTNIYQMIYNQYYFDYDAVSKEVFSSLKEMNTVKEKYNFDLLNIIKAFFSVEEGILYYEQFYRVLLLVMAVFVLTNSKGKKLETFLIVLSTLFVTWLFYFINRPVYRVIMPNYLLAILVILFIFLRDEEDKKNISLSYFIVYLLPLAITISFCYFNTVHKLDKETRHNEERQQIYKYLEANEDKLFLSGNLSVYSIDVCRPIFEFAGQNALWNLVGNWETFSVPYYELLENYDIENPDRLALELPDSDTLRIISNQGLGYIEFAQFFDEYIENITNRTVEIVPEEYIATLPDGEWWTFRVVYTD